MKKLMMLIILTANLASCGGGDNSNTSSNTKTRLEGNWLIPCYAKNSANPNTIYYKHTVSFKQNNFTSLWKSYSDSTCTVLSESILIRTILGSFTIGKKVTTLNGLSAYELNNRTKNVNGTPVDNYGYSIFRIEQNFLYIGTADISDKNNGTTPSLRHNKLKLTNYHIRQ